MSSEKPDDPLAPRDVTILRPRPGAGRRPALPPSPFAPAPAQPQSPAQGAQGQGYGAPSQGSGYGAPPSGQQSSGYGSPVHGSPTHNAPGNAYIPDGNNTSQSTSYTPRAAQSVAPTASPASLSELATAGSNPLLQSATPLLILAGRLRGQIANADIDSLRRQTVEEVRSFEERARRAEVPPEDVLAARYALCTVIDEAVLNTPWGAQSDWSGQSLLVTFHREAAGGEKFFQILDRVSGEPQRYAALLELLYVCLALGFEGKYRLDDRGNARLSEIRETLYRRLEGQRESIEPELSPRWKGVEDRRNAVLRFVPLWVVAAACAALLVGAYLFFDSKLGTQAEPVSAALASVGLESLDPVAPPAPGVATSGLRELLAQQITSGQISVEEAGDRTLITLKAADLFASGSARMNASYDMLLHDVGRALNGVPGRILVVGHTDDQALRSFRFKDNYELSRARALQVADLIRSVVTDGSRIEAAGKASLEPRYQPVDTPDNRARNRRVEIVHRRTS